MQTWTYNMFQTLSRHHVYDCISLNLDDHICLLTCKVFVMHYDGKMCLFSDFHHSASDQRITFGV